MKKNLVMLACASLIVFSSGCGDASTAVDNVKKDAAAQVQETASEVKEVAGKIEQKANVVAGGRQIIQNIDKKFHLGGIHPCMTFEEVKNILGEPVAMNDDDEFTFANGLVVEINKRGNYVEDIKTYQSEVSTGVGVQVGMSEQELLDVYGTADAIDHDDGKIEYKYYSADRRIKIEFEVRNGTVHEIKSQVKD